MTAEQTQLPSEPLITLRVPATSANLGSGFDTMGMALSLYNIFKVTALNPSGVYSIETCGEGSGELSDPRRNLIVEAYERACRHWHKETPAGFSLWCHNVIPLCRGLGSSSSAVVAGVILADILTGKNADRQELLSVMTRIEGHPDNVAPCFLGGMVVSCWDTEKEEIRYVPLPPLPQDVQCIAAVPALRVRTEDARKVLPRQVPFTDAVFNLGRSALLAAAWATGSWDCLKWGMDDRLHQPYRSQLFQGGEAIFSCIRNIPECLSVAISGSGPTVIALVRGPVQRTAEALCSTFTRHGVRSQFFVLDGCAQGALVRKHPHLTDILIERGFLS